MRNRVCALLTAATLTGGPALANDSTFGGAGADLVPLEQGDVAMRSEDIRLTARDSNWDVRARYVFFNDAAKAVTLQVGFPEYRCDPDGDCRDVAFRNLVTTVDGKPVTHRNGKLDKRHAWASYLGTVWLFDVTFPPERELVIEHEYSLSAGSDVTGNLFTTYVTRTGASWKGSIGRARFTAILPPYTHTVRQPLVAGARVEPPRLLLDGTPRVELVIEASDWTPRGEISISFNAGFGAAEARLPDARAAWKKQPVAYDTLFPYSKCFAVSEPTADAAQACKNLIYAAKGYPFKSRALSERYYGGSPEFALVKTDQVDAGFWVRGLSELPGFSLEWFDAGDREWLRRLELAAKASAVPSTLALSPPVEASSSPSASPSKPLTVEPPAAPARKSCSCRLVGAESETGGAALGLLGALAALAWRRRAATS